MSAGNLGISEGAGAVAAPAGPPRKALSLRRNFSWTLVGNGIFAACQWAMLMTLAKLGTPEMVGEFGLALAITTPIVLFANLSLRTVQVTDARDDYRFGHYLALRLAGMASASAVILALVLVSNYPRGLAAVILMITLSKLFDSLSDIFYGLIQRRERMDLIARSRILQGCCSSPASPPRSP